MPETDDGPIIEEIAAVCKRLADAGMVSATDGNVSVRTERDTFLVTRSSVFKGDVSASDILEVDAGGNVLGGSGKPSTELQMHVSIYSERADVHAVIHAHPIYATSFAVAGIPLDEPVLPEVMVQLGRVPIAPYATPSTREVGDSLRPYVGSHNAILLANHGVVTYGETLRDAYFLIEKLEHAAHIIFNARMLGGERKLSPEQIRKLKDASRENYGRTMRWDG
jgi:L-fuculose-phosphate aldolase